MKYTFILFSFCLCCCTPRDSNSLYLNGTVAIKAQVINPKTTISLGDSVAFDFEVPDSVILNGVMMKATVGNGDGASLGFFVDKIDSTRPAGFIYDPTLNYYKAYANPGSIGPTGTFLLANIPGKLTGRFYVIPQKKGIYFLDQTQEGYMDINYQSLKVRISIDFGNVNRNHQMLIDSAGVLSRFNLFLQDKIDRGLEVYGFRVK